MIKDVAAMYQAVRQTAEDNTPDTYLPMEGAGKKLLGQKDNRVTPLEMLGSSTMGDSGEMGEGSADGGTRRKSGVEEESENTPLLKHREP